MNNRKITITKAVVVSASSSASSSNLFKCVAKYVARRYIADRVILSEVTLPDHSSQKTICQALEGTDCVLVPSFQEFLPIIGHLVSYFCSKECLLKYLQFNFAGCEVFFNKMEEMDLTPPTYPVCRFGRYMGKHMSEFVIGNIIARERHFLDIAQNQRLHCWDRSDFSNYRQLNSLTIGIIGVGEIGKEVAKACKGFGMTVWGLTRSKVSNESGCPYVDHYRQIDGLGELMASSDYVCNILPSTAQTRSLLTEDLFKLCAEKRSVFINVGRGDVTTERAIVKAIKNDWLGGAILDVFQQEPLPKDSPLWDLPGVTIFPHVSACSRDEEIAELFAEQLERSLNGQPLLFPIDFERGY